MQLGTLLDAVRAISPHAQVHFLPVPDRDDIWVLRVIVGSVVIVETAAGPLDEIGQAAGQKLRSMSRRMLAVVKEQED